MALKGVGRKEDRYGFFQKNKSIFGIWNLALGAENKGVMHIYSGLFFFPLLDDFGGSVQLSRK